MKTKQILPILLVALSFVISSFNFQNNSIIGEWIEEDNVNSKWVFTTDNKLKIYTNNVLKETYTYTISSTSPQCSKPVSVGSGESYLRIVSTSNSTNISCYQINGIDYNGSGILSLTYFINGRVVVLNRP